MTGSKVLIVKLPDLHADVKQLEAFRAYVCDALGAGALVLPLGTTYAVEEFPPLGAVEVTAEETLTVVLGGAPPTPSGGNGGLVIDGRVVATSVPDSGTGDAPEILPASAGVSRPDPKPADTPTRPPSERVVVPQRMEITLPLAVGEATPRPRFAGKGANEKADIFARLNRYWSERGPGAMNKLSEASGLDASKLYLMQRNEGKFEIEYWRQVAAGLDTLGYGGAK